MQADKIEEQNLADDETQPTTSPAALAAFPATSPAPLAAISDQDKAATSPAPLAAAPLSQEKVAALAQQALAAPDDELFAEPFSQLLQAATSAREAREAREARSKEQLPAPSTAASSKEQLPPASQAILGTIVDLADNTNTAYSFGWAREAKQAWRIPLGGPIQLWKVGYMFSFGNCV